MKIKEQAGKEDEKLGKDFPDPWMLMKKQLVNEEIGRMAAILAWAKPMKKKKLRKASKHAGKILLILECWWKHSQLAKKRAESDNFDITPNDRKQDS